MTFILLLNRPFTTFKWHKNMWKFLSLNFCWLWNWCSVHLGPLMDNRSCHLCFLKLKLKISEQCIPIKILICPKLWTQNNFLAYTRMENNLLHVTCNNNCLICNEKRNSEKIFYRNSLLLCFKGGIIQKQAHNQNKSIFLVRNAP